MADADTRHKNLMRDRQRPLTDLYQREPAAAWITDYARTEWRDDDPLHSHVAVAREESVPVPISVHTAVGGDSDAPTPGDVICAALASCIDSTTRVVANRLRIPIRRLVVTVTGEVDVRGTLLVDASVPVGFQRFDARVELDVAPEVDASKKAMLMQADEHCCVIVQTVRQGVPVTLSVVGKDSEDAAA